MTWSQRWEEAMREFSARCAIDLYTWHVSGQVYYLARAQRHAKRHHAASLRWYAALTRETLR